MLDSRQREQVPDATFSITETTGRTVVAIVLGVLATIPALLLSGAPRIAVLATIWLSVAAFVDAFRFEVNPRERTVTVRRLWWNLLQRSSKTYSFDHVHSLRKAMLGDGIDGYRWDFRDGARYELTAPIDARLIDFFPARGNPIRERSVLRWNTVVLLVFLLTWTGGTLCFDFFIGRKVVRQVLAQRYPHVIGKLLKKDIERSRRFDSSDLWAFEPDVAYSYTANGADYRGERYSYTSEGPGPNFSEPAAKAMLPQGPEVAVYYNPRDPGDAVLSPGLGGAELFALLALVPFNAAVAVGFSACIWSLRYRRTKGIAIWDNGRVLRAGLQRWSPATAAFAIAGVAAFVLLFAVGGPTGGNPSIPLVSFAWLLIVFAGALAWYASARALAKTDLDLIVDRERQLITLPALSGRKEPLTIPWRSVSDIVVEDTQNDSETVHYAPVLVVTRPDGTTTRERLTDSQIEARAGALADWVRGLLRPEVAGGSHFAGPSQ